jgi:hypothetical protein
VAVVLTLVQTQQIKINIHKRNNTKTPNENFKTQQIQVHILPKHPHITKPKHSHTHALQNPHIHTPTHYRIHTYKHPHITKSTHTHTHTLQNPHIHTPTHYKTHTLQNPHRSEEHTSELQSPLRISVSLT